MFYLLFTLLFVVMALLAVLGGMRKGKKYIWSYSVARLVVAIVSAVAAAFLSAKLSFFVFQLIFSAIEGGTGDFAMLLTSVPVMVEALSALVSMFVAPVMFYVVFSILRHLLNLLAKTVLRSIAKKRALKKGTLVTETESAASAEDATVTSGKKSKKKKKHKDDGYFRVDKKKNPLGGLCGAVCGLVVFLFTMIPAVGMLGILSDMTAWGLSDSMNPITQNIVEFVDAGANNKGAQAVRVMGGDALYSMMTTYEVDGEKATLAKETNLLGTVGHAIADMTNKELPRKDAADTVRQIDDAFKETTLIPAVLPDFMNAAKATWDRGEEYCGIDRPGSGKNGGLIVPILNVFGNSSKETINDDISTLIDSMAYMVEKDALTDVKDDPMSMFKKKDVTAKVMCDLLKNDHLAPLVGDVSEYGIHLFGETIGTTMDNIDLDSSKVNNPEMEAALLAEALAEMAELTETIKRGGQNDLSSIVAFGPLMDQMALTETVGRENTDKMMVNILASNHMTSLTKLSREDSLAAAEKITEGAKTTSYTWQLSELATMIAMKEQFPNVQP